MRYYRKTHLLLALLITSAAWAQVDVENENAETFLLSAYGRIRYSEFGGALVIPDRSFTVESAGLSADFLIDDNLEGQIQLEILPDEIFLKDCYLQWAPTDFLTFQAGRFKKPFCLNSILSTWNLQSIQHSISHREVSDLLYSGRDLGGELTVNPDPIWLPNISLGVFNGAVTGVNQDNELQYVGRAEFDSPIGITAGADLSALRFGREEFGSIDGYVVSARQLAYGADLQYEADVSTALSFLLRGEFIRGDNWALVDVMGGEDPPQFQTWWVTGGVTWRTRKPLLDQVTAAASLSSWEPDRSQGVREDELTVSLSFDTGTPVGVRLAAVNHRPHNILTEQKRTDYMLEMTFRI